MLEQSAVSLDEHHALRVGPVVELRTRAKRDPGQKAWDVDGKRRFGIGRGKHFEIRHVASEIASQLNGHPVADDQIANGIAKAGQRLSERGLGLFVGVFAPE